MYDELPLPRIVAVAPSKDRRLQIMWATGFKEEVDVAAALVSRSVFADLTSDTPLFRRVVVGEERNHVTWGGDRALTAVWLARLPEQQNGIAHRS